MKNRILLYGFAILMAIVSINFFLWQSSAEEVAEVDKPLEASKPELHVQDQISDNYEYPAPVKQLQQVLVKSYQPPSFDGEEIFPDELLTPDDTASAAIDTQAKIDQLRKRIELIK